MPTREQRPVALIRRVLVLACASAAAAPAAAPARADMTADAQVFLEGQLAQMAGDVEISVGAPDPRTTLTDCARIEPFIPPGARLWGRGHVGLRCVAGATWTTYLPVSVRVYGSAPVATHPIARGDIVTAADIQMTRIELSQWPVGEIATAEQAIGHVSTRAIAAAEPLRRGSLRAQQVVAAGDTVQVTIDSGYLQVSSEGRALTAAAAGESVQVALASGKLVWGTAGAGKMVKIR